MITLFWSRKLAKKRYYSQDSYLEFYFGISQDWKVLENDFKSWKVLEICKLCFDHVIFTVSTGCGMHGM